MPKKPETKLLKVAALGEIRDGQSKKFGIRRGDRVTEAFLIRKDGRHFAYLNLCRHWTVGLDFDDNEFFSEDGKFLICKNHGAVYHPESGQCLDGPCGGASLYPVPLVEKEGFLFADTAKIQWGDGPS